MIKCVRWNFPGSCTLRLTLFLSLIPAGFGAPPGKDGPSSLQSPRPAAWAQPLKINGVPNLHKVSATLYRSAQPTAAGMQRLERLGIKTIVNLRKYHSDKAELQGTRLVGIAIPMHAWHPENEDVVRFLRIMRDSARTPVLVHCQHGADRTGTMVAVYRMAVQGWSKEAALREMVDGGYGFHGIWENLLQYLSRLDIAAITRQVHAAPAVHPEQRQHGRR